MPVIIPGITFPDLATPPANTALGTLGPQGSGSGGTPYSALNIEGTIQLDNYFGSHANATLSFVQAIDPAPNNWSGMFGYVELYPPGDVANLYGFNFEADIIGPINVGRFDLWKIQQDNDSSALIGEANMIYLNPNVSTGITLFRGVLVGDMSSSGASTIRPFDYAGKFYVDGSGGVVSQSTVTATDFIVSGSRFKSDTTNGHTGGLAVYDVDGTAYKDFLVWTNANAPAVVLSTPAGGTFSGDFSMLTIASAAVATQTYVNAQGFVTASSTTAFTNKSGSINQWSGNLPVSQLNSGTSASGSTFWRGDGTWAAAGAGTVTSIDTTSPISGGTITGTGTLSLLVNVDFAFTVAQSVTKTINATSADGLLLTNTTAAAAGAQQWSPRIHLTGQGWKTTSTAASQTVDWVIENQPQQGSTNPGTKLVFSSQVNGAGYSGVMTVDANGNIAARSYGGLSANIEVNPNDSKIYMGTSQISWGSSLFGGDAILLRGGAAATFQFGLDTNGAAVSQTIQAANGITGTDKTGGNFTWASGKGTGAGAVSSLILQTPTVLTTGTTAQSLATRLTISSASLNATVPVAFSGNLCLSNAVPTISSGFGSGATIAGIAGGFRITCGTAPGVGGTVAFNATYANAPVCFVQDETTGILGIAAPTTTTVVISGLTLLAGQTVAVFVFGY